MTNNFYECLKFGREHEIKAQDKIKNHFYQCKITTQQDEHNYKYIHYDFEILYEGKENNV